MASIKLFRGAFGHVSVLKAACDLVTHAHPEAHVIIWLEGDPGRIVVGDAEVSPGPYDAVCVNSLQSHSHHFSDGTPGAFLAFYLQPDWVAARIGRPAGESLFQSPVVRLRHELRAGALSLLHRVSGDIGGGELSCDVEQTIGGLIEGIGVAQAAAPTRPFSSARLDPRIRRALALMQENISGRVGLDEVARGAGLSRPHFFSLFKEQTGLTPNVYLNTLRMEAALRQVEDERETLTSVACNLGFTTQANFTRFFRDHAGVPPTLYREAARTAV